MTQHSERLPFITKDPRRNLIRAFKASGCTICGTRYPELDWSELEIDHLNGHVGPRLQICESAQGVILAELLVCQVLCYECHKAKHRNGLSAAESQLALFNGDGSWRYAA